MPLLGLIEGIIAFSRDKNSKGIERFNHDTGPPG